MAKRPKLIVCPVKPKPPAPPPHIAGPGPSVEGAPVLSLFEKAIDPFQDGADLAAGNNGVLGSNNADPSDTSETAQSINGLSFTAGSAKIKTIKFTNPNSIVVGGDESGSQYTWTVSANGHKLEGHLGGPNGAVAIILSLTGPFQVGPGGTLNPTITATLTDAFPHNDVQGANEIQITGIHVTATDKNNKKATGDVAVHVVDDLPAASNAAVATDTLVLDETRPVGTETDGDNAPAGLATVQANFADNFNAPIYGADGPGTTTYSLVLFPSMVTGLFALDPSDTTIGDSDGIGQGEQIVLNQSGDTITGSAGGNNYFTISINETTGVVTFTQLANIWHANTGSDDDTSTLTLAAPNRLLVVQTVTDADGDIAGAFVNVGTGVFQIEDDGPSATNDGNAATENGPQVLGNVLTNDDAGTDLPGTVSAVSGGSVGAPIVTALGTLVLNSDGTFTYTPNPSVPAGSVDNFTYTLMDADGDTTTATLSFTFAGDSNHATAGSTTALVDEDDLAAGNHDAAFGDDDPTPQPGLLPHDYGLDGTGTTKFVAGAEVVNLVNYTYSVSPDGLILTAHDDVNNVDVFTATLSDNSSGSYTVQLLAPIDHPIANEDNLDFHLSYAVLDSDDVAPVNGTLTLTIDDDSPISSRSTGGVTAVVLDETRPVGTETDGDNAPAGLATVQANFADNFNAPIYGADGPGTTTYSLVLFPSNVTGLFALDPLDTTIGDGDGIGQGAQIVLNQSGDTVTGSAGGNDYFTISIDPTTGVVTFAQSANIWHANTGSDDDTSTLTLAAPNRLLVVQTVTDADGDSNGAFVNVGTGVFQIEDDGPSAANITRTINEGARDANLSLILDVSGSMNDPSQVTGLSRLDILKAAAIELLEQYDNVGDVRIQLVTFSTGAQQVGSDWMTIAAAKPLIQGLVAGGTTNYDAALAQLQAIFGHTGKLATPGVQNVSYFVSDGVPNEPAGSAGISPAEETTWSNFLNANSLNSFALGAGGGVVQSALDPIAYNGQTHVNTNAEIVTDLGQLSLVLSGTVAAITGNLLTEGPGSFGTDGGYVKSVTANATTYTYDPATDAITAVGPNAGSFNNATNVLTIALANGASFTIDVDDGSYGYTAPAVVNANISEPIGFTLTDTDGDTQSATLTLNVTNADLAPIVRDDSVITNITGAGAVIVIPDYALLNNDIDPDAQVITITGAGSANDGAIVDNATDITFTDNDTDGGNFTYTGTAGALFDTGLATINRAQAGATTLVGTGLNNILIGTSGAETLDGNEGRDVLIGGAGNDRFDFNATVDSPSLAGADLIGDFEGANAVGGDVIDLASFAGTFLFGGNNASVVANSVTWFQNGGNTIVQADVNGNTTADLVIVLRGLHTLAAGDFSL